MLYFYISGMEKITFNDLPEAVEKLIAQLARIENILLNERTVPVDDLMNIDQAAEFLDFKKNTLYVKVCRGELPHFKQGSRLRFSRKDLEAWIREEKHLTAKQSFNEKYYKR